MIKKPFPISAALGILFLALAGVAVLPSSAQTTQPESKKPGGQFIQSIGDVTIDSEQNIITANGIDYTNAHMRTTNGATVDCHDLRGDMDKSGNFTQFVATGNVIAHVPLAAGQTYNISTEKAVYDLSTHEIDLTGNPVTATAETPYTKGPVVQTGDSGVVLLGPSPKYPKITDFPTILMNNVHTQFTPVQQSGSATHADSRQEPGQGIQGPQGRQ
jgi:hypothetical protein